MYLKELIIDNFKNLRHQKVKFSKGINVIYGKNAQGKSNLLECIRILSIGKSFRNSKNKDMINFNSDYYYIKGIFDVDTEDMVIEMGYKMNQNKIIKLNNNKVKNISELVGSTLTTVFSPEDLNIIKNSPSIRRRYIDTSISMIKRNYLFDLLQYNKVLNNRNKVLKDIKFKNNNLKLLDIMDEQLSIYGSKIILYRMQYIKNLNIIVKKILHDISKEDVDLKYSNNVIEATEELNDIKKAINNKLKFSREIDLKYGDTKYGPQRDDIKIYINGHDSRIYASQGQQRTIALCLKLAEQEIIKMETHENPILLLDDVMSELDSSRRSYILNRINGSQTFITHTEKDDIKGDKYFLISDGSIISE
ncbi:DNA replication/repair protein RecF [Thermoanaerobacterium sp. RBIITD]|uniref:DNA replication/repair protein RecF n=1 Tax=Thermoanaerobacterium sp. RBIITD TaxID=1550240 RepID=UPI000BB79109|nr:DNA replication/repair protein RecF [Thermoanaerobacterium sp. RBIITD]SNX53786.1 DNA replication and repair protein RecF [Thermoanaerobacterium sp. RBIITD]